MNAEIRAINCTSCGATLDVLGGHRVKSLTCGYCGSVMDRHAGYQVLQQYRQKPERPDTPLAIGMEATLKGVPFTIIGMIEYVSHQSGDGWAESYRWVSFQLYSPTHGYTWLTWNKGHYLFSYRTRDIPDPAVPERLVQKMDVAVEGRTFRMFEGYAAEIAYVEGELTWIAKLGDEVHVVEAIDPPGMFSYERTDRELEYSLGEYMDPDEVHAAFDLDPPTAPKGIHPAQPFTPPSILSALAKVGPIFAVIALIGFFVVIIMGNGKEIVRFEAASTRGPQIVPFTVSDAGRLLQLELTAPLNNNWVYYDVTVSDVASDEAVLSLGKEIAYYTGRDSDGHWAEGSQRASALFKVPAAGDYKLEITLAEAGGAVPPLRARLYEQVLVKRYVVILLILAILASIALPLMRYHFEKRRWADVLEDDDDDSWSDWIDD
ncbi:MAG: DUF4178 domain-containing protein [Geminicoccaceae bacterium]